MAQYHLARLTHLDRATGRPIRRYEHAVPGLRIHVDFRKLGNIPDRGGHKIRGRAAGGRNSSAHHGRPNLGYGYLHNAIDDHSRLAYTEILADETEESAAAFWHRAHAYFTRCGITVRRGSDRQRLLLPLPPGSRHPRQAGITHKRTRPYRPQTNGKAERRNRILLDEWAYAQPYTSEAARRAALPA